MKHEEEHIDYELISKYLAGEADAGEEVQLQAWMDASEQNQKDFADMELLWKHTGRVIPHEKADVDVDAAWSTFKQKADQKKSVAPKAKVRPMYYLARVAAVLIFGAVVYLAYRALNTEVQVVNSELQATTEAVNDSLPDGSLISLNVNSTLTYPENFTGNQRPVELEGEAFFKVAPDKQKPFIIKAEQLTVTVVGTAFYVNAYDSLGAITVGVEEGIVKVAANGEEFTLTKGQHIEFNKEASDFKAVDHYNANKIFWKTGNLTFQNESLKQVFQAIEEAYHVSVQVENPEILNCKLTAKFQDQPVDSIFDIINTNFNLNSENRQGKFHISGQGCQ
ncbi:FecR family protein [Fulvivirga ligni]|uniref:FecR family protein n=1 Tax=Fulvivirga ligni TaxID=2904246 RepID=UPI001F383821|nr:FecR domain-containing protein [Fulvivirga ligni]UII24266.1 FecR domain-containing protein [Fulvivirga ligni]